MGPLATLLLYATPPLLALLTLAWLAPPALSPLFDTLAVAVVAVALTLAGRRLHAQERRLRDALATTGRQLDDQAAELAAARAEVARAAGARRAFLTTISHELRTPMTAFIGMTRLALGSDLSPRQREWLNRADRAAHQLQGQIEDILDYVRAESGTIPLHRQAFRLDDVLAGVLARAGATMGGKDLRLRLAREAAVPALLVGDGRRLGQVLGALADNAVKFTDDGEVVICARLLGRDTNGVELEFEVRDSGPAGTLGGPDSQALFDAFTQADHSLSRRHGGAGLGLGLCRQLVARMDGRLEVHTLPGLGTQVRVRLRFDLEPSAAMPAEPRAADRPPPLVADAAPAGAATTAVLDLAPARRRSGSEQRLRRLLRRFVADQVGFIDDYRTLHADGDRLGAARLARELTSAAAGLGARELAIRASRLALARRAEDDPTPLLDQVAAELGAVIAAVTGVLNQPVPLPTAPAAGTRPAGAPRPAAPVTPLRATAPGPAPTPAPETPRMSPADAATALNELATLLGEFDAAAINAFARLRPALEGQGPVSQLDALQHDISGFDFSRALPRVFEFARTAGIDLTAAALATSARSACTAGQRLH